MTAFRFHPKRKPSGKDAAHPTDAGAVATKLIAALARPLVLSEGLELHTSASVGIAMCLLKPYDQGDSDLARGVIAPAHQLKFQVIAEGVETAQQLDFVRDSGCGIYRGRFYVKAMPALDLANRWAAERAQLRVP